MFEDYYLFNYFCYSFRHKLNPASSNVPMKARATARLMPFVFFACHVRIRHAITIPNVQYIWRVYTELKLHSTRGLSHMLYW